MDLIVVGKGAIKGASTLKKLLKWAKVHRSQLLFATIQKELETQYGLSEGSIEQLIRQSMDETYREIINSAASNALLAESTLGVRMMAIKTAKHIHNRQEFSYDDIRTLRALQDLTDEEIIFVKKLLQLHKDGKFPPSEDNINEPYEARMIRPCKEFFSFFDFPTEHFIPKVQRLKEHGIIADNPSGFSDTLGGWGYARISDATNNFVDLIHKAEGYDDSLGIESFEAFEAYIHQDHSQL